jgi:hypothetical protein
MLVLRKNRFGLNVDVDVISLQMLGHLQLIPVLVVLSLRDPFLILLLLFLQLLSTPFEAYRVSMR